ncbi:hypothetical protein I203_106111 [Kwoniella mangroviensis CBS 8507]|uniref:uncharacterized protein n=1 Tax=Kwoniella mangroviensis CBS 8507 TaxID=1296122 RepID=UPI00303C66AC
MSALHNNAALSAGALPPPPVALNGIPFHNQKSRQAEMSPLKELVRMDLELQGWTIDEKLKWSIASIDPTKYLRGYVPTVGTGLKDTCNAVIIGLDKPFKIAYSVINSRTYGDLDLQITSRVYVVGSNVQKPNLQIRPAGTRYVFRSYKEYTPVEAVLHMSFDASSPIFQRYLVHPEGKSLNSRYTTIPKCLELQLTTLPGHSRTTPLFGMRAPGAPCSWVLIETTNLAAMDLQFEAVDCPSLPKDAPPPPPLEIIPWERAPKRR